MAPARADIDPVDFRYALGWVNLAEVRPGSDHFEFRVFGTSLARVMDLDAPMASTADTDDPAFDAVARRDMTRVLPERKPLRVFRAMKAAGRGQPLQALFTPLSRGEAEARRSG